MMPGAAGRWSRIVACAALLAHAGAFAWGGEAAPTAAAATGGRERAEPGNTVAVPGLRDLGPSVDLEPLRRAQARMLVTDLTSYGQIEVVARGRVDQLRELAK